jgi:hypothetical protein
MNRYNVPEQLEIIWDALTAYREDLIPEGDEMYDKQWDDICTAMAWITEDLGLEYIDGELVDIRLDGDEA